MTTTNDVLHELNVARRELRLSSSELNRSLSKSGGVCDLPKIEHFASKVVDQLDALDVIFELLRIELNPLGIAFAPREQINIHKYFYRAFAHNAHRMRDKRLTWYMDKDLGFVISAFPSLEIVPMILIDNAIKYAPNGSKIYVYLNRENKTVAVESPGPLIRDDELRTIFEEGVRGYHAMGVQEAGQGRGLYIAKNILDAHKFSISITQSGRYSLNQVPYANVTFEVGLDESL